MKHFVWLSTPVLVTDLMCDQSGNVHQVVPDTWIRQLEPDVGLTAVLLGTWPVIAMSGGRNDQSPVKRSIVSE